MRRLRAAPDVDLSAVPASVEGSPNHPGGRVAGMIFVGAPIGSDEYVKDAVRAEFESLAANLPTLSQLRDHGRLTTASQARALLLRYCANPQTNFLLRTVAPGLVRDAAAAYDAAVAKCLKAAVFSGAPGDRRWKRAVRQASLPVPMGGL